MNSKSKSVITMMTSMFLSAVFLFWSLTIAAAFTSRCGNCWCVPSDSTDTVEGTCPSIEPGIVQSEDIPSSWPSTLGSLQLTSNEIQLVDADGSPCYPFANSVGPLDYSESQNGQCVQTEIINTPGASSVPSTSLVCAYKYDSTAACSGQSYQLATYVNATDALSDDATMIHSGPCGVCSNAHDFAIRLTPIDFSSLTIQCGVTFTFDSNFDDLVQCFVNNLGLTTPCSTLWAHFTATNAARCANVCIGDVVLNESPPQCELGPCLNCSKTIELDFNLYGGIWKSPSNAGINDKVAYPCAAYTRIETYDPCLDSTNSSSSTDTNNSSTDTSNSTGNNNPTPATAPQPTSAPVASSSGSGNNKSTSTSHAVNHQSLILVGWTILAMTTVTRAFLM